MNPRIQTLGFLVDQSHRGEAVTLHYRRGGGSAVYYVVKGNCRALRRFYDVYAEPPCEASAYRTASGDAPDHLAFEGQF